MVRRKWQGAVLKLEAGQPAVKVEAPVAGEGTRTVASHVVVEPVIRAGASVLFPGSWLSVSSTFQNSLKGHTAIPCRRESAAVARGPTCGSQSAISRATYFCAMTMRVTIAVSALAAALIAVPAPARADCGDSGQDPCTGPVPTVDQVVAVMAELTDPNKPAIDKADIVTPGFTP